MDKRRKVNKDEVDYNNKIEVRQLQVRQKNLAKQYQNEEKVEVIISPMYMPHFGKIMPVIINGIPIYVPCNGKAIKIPKTYAAVVKQRIYMVDQQLRRAKRMGDVQQNIESYAGSRRFI